MNKALFLITLVAALATTNSHADWALECASPAIQTTKSKLMVTASDNEYFLVETYISGYHPNRTIMRLMNKTPVKVDDLPNRQYVDELKYLHSNDNYNVFKLESTRFNPTVSYDFKYAVSKEGSQIVVVASSFESIYSPCSLYEGDKLKAIIKDAEIMYEKQLDAWVSGDLQPLWR